MPTGKHLCRWSFRCTGGPATCRSGPCSSRTGGSTATSSPHRPALQTICGRRGTAAAAHALQAGSAPPASTRRARSAREGGGADKPSPIFSYSLQARCLTRPGRRATATPPAARVMTPAGGRPARTRWHRRTHQRPNTANTTQHDKKPRHSLQHAAQAAALLDELLGDVCVDASRVFATGVSNGAISLCRDPGRQAPRSLSEPS